MSVTLQQLQSSHNAQSTNPAISYPKGLIEAIGAEKLKELPTIDFKPRLPHQFEIPEYGTNDPFSVKKESSQFPEHLIKNTPLFKGVGEDGRPFIGIVTEFCVAEKLTAKSNKSVIEWFRAIETIQPEKDKDGSLNGWWFVASHSFRQHYLSALFRRFDGQNATDLIQRLVRGEECGIPEIDKNSVRTFWNESLEQKTAHLAKE